MKTIKVLLFIFLISAINLGAQVPNKFTYQAVVRNSSGNPVVSQTVSFRFSILSGSVSGPVLYSETQQLNSSATGLVNIEIGNGNVVSGTMINIDWAATTTFLKVEMDISGGTSYVLMGTQQLVSVPYALQSQNAKATESLRMPFNQTANQNNTLVNIQNNGTGTVMDLSNNTGSTTSPVLKLENQSTDANAKVLSVYGNGGNSGVFQNSNGTAIYADAPGGTALYAPNGSVGIGTAFPQQKLDVNGGIKIGNTIVQTPGSLRYNGNNFEGYNGTSWVQLNGGGSPDNWGTQTVVTGSELNGDGTSGNPLSLSSQGAGTGDVLKWNGSSWSPGTDLNGGASQWTSSGNDIQNNNLGRVYVGSSSGSGKLSVTNNTGALYAIDGISNGSGGIAINGRAGVNGMGIRGESTGNNQGIGVYGTSEYGTGGVFTSANGYALRTGTGNVGLGVSAPEEKLEVDGAIKIGNNVDPTPDNGSVRYTATDGFEFRHANTWTAFKQLWNTNNGTDIYSLNSGNIGIGTSTPGAKLEVAGQVKITGGAPGAGKVLTSDANGLASWQTPSGASYTSGSGINISGNTISNTGDLSSTNEIQTLSLSGNTLSLSNGGGSVTLPSSGGSQWADYASGIEYNNGKVKVGPQAGLTTNDNLFTIGTNSNQIGLEILNLRTGTQVGGLLSSISSTDNGSSAIAATTTLGSSPIEPTHYGVLSAMDDGGIGVASYSIGGNAMRAKSNTGLALYTTGALKFNGIGEGAGKVLTSDANGNATWANPTTVNYTGGTGISITGTTINNTGDLSNSNELQTISKSGNTISLSNGGGSVTDSDAQTLSLSGNTLSITGGNSVTLPSGGGGSSYWSLNGSNHIYPNNTGNVLIGSFANGSTGARLEVNEDALFGKVASFSNTSSSYTVVLEAMENGTSGGPMGCVGCMGNAAIKAGANYGDALFAYSNSRAMYIKGGSAFYPTVRIEQNAGVTNPAIDMDGQIKIRGGNPGAGKVLTCDDNGLATWESPTGSSYVAGTGINISGNTISAQASSPLWNASKISNTNVSATTPNNGQVLQFNGTSWAPATPASSSNIYDNITEHFQSGSAQATSVNPTVDIPGLSKTFTVSGNAKVIINSQVGLIASCVACGDHQAALELNVDGNTYVMSFYSLDNMECTQAHIDKIVSVGAGTHTIKIRLVWLNGASVTAGNVNGCYSSNDVYMDAVVINQ